MEGDSFADPRRRSARGRGRGRGSKDSRGRGRSARGRGRGRGGAKRPDLSQPKGEELGSNAYRFRAPEEEEEDFDAGVDFEEAAAASMSDDPHAKAAKEDVGLQFTADLSGMDRALESLPLWVRLGDVSRFSLGVKDSDVIENYLDPLDDDGGDLPEKPKVGDALASELAQLDFETDDEDDEDRGMTTKACESQTTAERAGPATETAEKDDEDFDKWLDDV